jgi:hypothetical protein
MDDSPQIEVFTESVTEALQALDKATERLRG